VTAKDPTYFDRTPLRVLLNRNATLNLIPVDVVVAEMLELERHGESTVQQVFHVTSESPVSVNDVLRTIARLLNIRNVEIAGSITELQTIDKLFNKQVKAFWPYLMQRKVFDRANIARYGVDGHQMNYLLDMERVMNFASRYLGTTQAAPQGRDNVAIFPTPLPHGEAVAA
jgi:hypothetical protein